MDAHSLRTRLRTEVQAFIRLYHAMEGTAIGLASVSLEGLDQSWRDRVQRIRALPREAPRRKNMIDALTKLIEQTLWKQRANLEKLQEIDPVLAMEAMTIARRGEAPEETANPSA